MVRAKSVFCCCSLDLKKTAFRELNNFMLLRNTSGCNTPSSQFESVAFIASHAIGDTLVSMVIVRNILRNGIPITVFGSKAMALRMWFPDVLIKDLPPIDELGATLSGFQVVMQMQCDQPFERLARMHPRVITLRDIEFGSRKGCMGERFLKFCKEDLQLKEVSQEIGLHAPGGARHRRYMQRVVIHPEASTIDKRWTKAQFIRLAQDLRARDFEVYFVIAPHERDRWADLAFHKISAPRFPDLSAMATWLYESGWFVGNDSGIGHLAAGLGIPSVIIFRRRGVAERWRPVWGAVRVVLPWQWVPTAYLKELTWRRTLTIRRVLRALNRLQIESSYCHGTKTSFGVAERLIAISSRLKRLFLRNRI